MRIAEIKSLSAAKVWIALSISKKPMTIIDLIASTGLPERTARYGVSELHGSGLIEVTRCDSPLYSECRVEYRLAEPLEAYTEKDVREMCQEADEDGSTGAKIKALQSLFTEWFPSADGWGRLYPQGAKTLLGLTNGSALAVYEGLEDSGVNPEIRDDAKIRTRKDPGRYCAAILRNKARGEQPKYSNGKLPVVEEYAITDELRELARLAQQQIREDRAARQQQRDEYARQQESIA